MCENLSEGKSGIVGREFGAAIVKRYPFGVWELCWLLQEFVSMLLAMHGWNIHPLILAAPQLYSHFFTAPHFSSPLYT